MKHIAVYPGTFDPVTKGHIDLVERSLTIFDELIVAVAANPKKKPLFSLKERIDMFRKVVARYSRVRIEGFDGLLVDYVREKKASGIVKGLRAVSDFENEMAQAQMNLNVSGVHTVFIPSTSANAAIASKFIRDIARFGGDVSSMVPDPVAKRIRKKFVKP